MLGDAQQVAALEAVGGRRSVPWLERSGLGHAPTRCEAVREDLVEHCVAHPVRAGRAGGAGGTHGRAEGFATALSIAVTLRVAGAAELAGAAVTGAVDPRMISRVSSTRCSGRSRSGLAIMRRSSRADSSPFCRIGWRTVVSGGGGWGG